MGRLIDPVDNTAVAAGSKTSRYGEAVAKYIPAEIIGGYLPLSRILSGAREDTVKTVLEWALFAAGVVLTPIYFERVQKPTPAQKRHVWISTTAFVLWAAALGGPFATIAILRDHQYVMGVLLGGFTWIVGFFPPRKRVEIRRPNARSE